ncbi:MAG: hypothetical protein HY695_04960 [Deltaproteobacteria bacterium]|nr:hypothetical protein [Deltaproteobacteria bacterium]
MPGKKINAKELALMKSMADLGHSPTAIAKHLDRSHHTVKKWLESDVYTDPAISAMVERIKDKELEDLYILGAKSRKRLHDLMDKGDAPMIPTIALMDRAFQQRRLLEGKSTENISQLTQIVEAAAKQRVKRLRDNGGDQKKADSGETKEPKGVAPCRQLPAK